MLTNEDIDVLMKALDAYKSKDANSGLMSVMLGAMLTKKEDKDSFMAEADEIMAKAKRTGEQLEETIILLKAKLIGMRDKAIVSEAADFLRDGK